MKKITLGLCLLMAAVSLYASNYTSSYQNSTIQAGVLEAAHTQKLLMAHFVADWCMPSQWMEEHTFSDPEISRYLQNDYLGINVDIDQVGGFKDKERYHVETLPTILIFSASGALLERIEGITDVQELRNYLSKHNQAIHKKAPLGLPKRLEKKSNAIDFSHLDRPAFEQKSSTPSNNAILIATPSLPMTMEEVYSEDPSTSSEPIKENKLPIDASKPQLYGVEVATLEQYGSVIQYVRSLEKRVSEKVFILLRQEGVQKTYHVIIGQLDNRKAAFALRSRLQKHDINGLVKALESL